MNDPKKPKRAWISHSSSDRSIDDIDLKKVLEKVAEDDSLAVDKGVWTVELKTEGPQDAEFLASLASDPGCGPPDEDGLRRPEGASASVPPLDYEEPIVDPDHLLPNNLQRIRHHGKPQKMKLALPPAVRFGPFLASVFGLKTYENTFLPTIADACFEWEIAHKCDNQRIVRWIHIRTWIYLVKGLLLMLPASLVSWVLKQLAR